MKQGRRRTIGWDSLLALSGSFAQCFLKGKPHEVCGFLKVEGEKEGTRS